MMSFAGTNLTVRKKYTLAKMVATLSFSSQTTYLERWLPTDPLWMGATTGKLSLMRVRSTNSRWELVCNKSSVSTMRSVITISDLPFMAWASWGMEATQTENGMVFLSKREAFSESISIWIKVLWLSQSTVSVMVSRSRTKLSEEVLYGQLSHYCTKVDVLSYRVLKDLYNKVNIKHRYEPRKIDIQSNYEWILNSKLSIRIF